MVGKWLKFKCLFRDLKKKPWKFEIYRKSNFSFRNQFDWFGNLWSYPPDNTDKNETVCKPWWLMEKNKFCFYICGISSLVMKNLRVLDPRVPSIDQNYGFFTCRVSLTITALFSTKIVSAGEILQFSSILVGVNLILSKDLLFVKLIKRVKIAHSF